jgi:hypothetical protein
VPPAHASAPHCPPVTHVLAQQTLPRQAPLAQSASIEHALPAEALHCPLTQVAPSPH